MSGFTCDFCLQETDGEPAAHGTEETDTDGMLYCAECVEGAGDGFSEFEPEAVPTS